VLAAKGETRTVIQTTLVDGVNIHTPEWYAAMCDRANVDFVETKAYMTMGHSRGRLDCSAVPSDEQVREFTEEVAEWLPDHDTYREVEQSRVALLARNEDTGVPEPKGDSEFWERDPYAETDRPAAGRSSDSPGTTGSCPCWPYQ
jgi:tRNA wybutosine-synthesizing protein 1